jgi:hypothetical protein
MLTIMLVKALEQCSHSVIPQLDASIVERCKNPRALCVKGNTFDTIALRLKL